MADEPMTPEDAIARMASVTSHTRGLRVRTEGLTLVVWAICMAASYLTIAVPIVAGELPHAHDVNDSANNTFEGPGERGFERGAPPPTAFFGSRLAPVLWYLIAVVVTIAIWRSASLSFNTGMSTPRLVAVFVGWLALFVVMTVLLAGLAGGRPQGWHLLAWGVVLGLFAGLNPLRFTASGRWAAAAVAAVTLLTAVWAFLAQMGARDTSFLAGVALGGSGLVAGLTLMFRG